MIQQALDYMLNTKDELFLVISDMNMTGMSGLDLKKATKKQVSEAYEYRVQGYFEKPTTISEQAAMLDLIIKYWIVCRHPKFCK